MCILANEPPKTHTQENVTSYYHAAARRAPAAGPGARPAVRRMSRRKASSHSECRRSASADETAGPGGAPRTADEKSYSPAFVAAADGIGGGAMVALMSGTSRRMPLAYAAAGAWLWW